MSTGKWTVRVHQSRHDGARHPKCRWMVDPPGYGPGNRRSGWHDAGGRAFRWAPRDEQDRHHAYREALAYAHTMARIEKIIRFLLDRPPIFTDLLTKPR